MEIKLDKENIYLKKNKNNIDKFLEKKKKIKCWLCNTNKNIIECEIYGNTCKLCLEKMKCLQLW